MTKEQQALKDFLGNLGTNTDEAELNLGEGTPEGQEGAASTDEGATTTDDQGAQTEDIGAIRTPKFHELRNDPRFERFVAKEIKKRMGDIQPTRQEQFISDATNEDSSLVDAFTAIIGNDTPEKVAALNQLKRTISQMDARTKAAEGAVQVVEQYKERDAEVQRSREYLQDSFEEIEDSYGIDLLSNSAAAKKTRGDFVEFLEKISPKDEFGDIKEYADPVEAYEIFQTLKKPQPSTQAKNIVARSVSRSSADAANTPTKRITFENVREMMGLEN